MNQFLRGMFRYRVNTQRGSSSGEDNFGNPLPPDYQPYFSDMPAAVWSKSINDISDDGKVAVQQLIQAMVAQTADVIEGDRVSSITDRLGKTIWEGPLDIIAVEEKNANATLVSMRKVD